MTAADDPQPRRGLLPDTPLPKVMQISADQSSAFGILRRARVDSDDVPEERRKDYANGMIGRFGLNAALSRHARTDAGDVWVIPANGHICLDVGGMCCAATEVARARGIVTWTSTRSRCGSIVHGLAPDGVQEVVLTATNGTTKTVQVTDNVYGTVMEGSFTSLRLSRPNGTVEVGPWG